jgi:hypothetical protein
MRKDRVRVAGGVKQLVAIEYLCHEFGVYLESEVIGANFVSVHWLRVTGVPKSCRSIPTFSLTSRRVMF